MPGVVRSHRPPPPLLPSTGASWGRREHVPEIQPPSSDLDVPNGGSRLDPQELTVSHKLRIGNSSRDDHYTRMATSAKEDISGVSAPAGSDNTRLSAVVCTRFISEGLANPENDPWLCRQPPPCHLTQTPAVKPSTAADFNALGGCAMDNQSCCRRRRESASLYIENHTSSKKRGEEEEEETCNELVGYVDQNCCIHRSSRCQSDTTQSVNINNKKNSNLIRDNCNCCCYLESEPKERLQRKNGCKITSCRTLSGKSFPNSISDSTGSRTSDRCDEVADCSADRVSEDDICSRVPTDHLRSDSHITTGDSNEPLKCLPAPRKSAARAVPSLRRASSSRPPRVFSQLPGMGSRKGFGMRGSVRVALAALFFFLALGLDNRILGANATGELH